MIRWDDRPPPTMPTNSIPRWPVANENEQPFELSLKIGWNLHSSLMRKITITRHLNSSDLLWPNRISLFIAQKNDTSALFNAPISNARRVYLFTRHSLSIDKYTQRVFQAHLLSPFAWKHSFNGRVKSMVCSCSCLLYTSPSPRD